MSGIIRSSAGTDGIPQQRYKPISEGPAMAESKQSVIVDLGERTRGAISRLKRGEGELMDDLRDCIQELQTHQLAGQKVQPVFVVVEKEARMTDFSSWI